LTKQGVSAVVLGAVAKF